MHISGLHNSLGQDIEPSNDADFTRTHWSVVMLAAQDTPEGSEALSTLCRLYWRPVYVFIRRRGYTPPDAQDLTQEFFLRLIQQRSMASADPKRGRFRSFLLGILQHFLADEWDKARAAKRGGRLAWISLDDPVETTYLERMSADLPPEQVFARQWAWTLINAALERMTAEYAAEGKTHLFESLKPFLTDEPRAEGYETLSTELGLTRNTVAKTIQRLRERFRLLVRCAAAQTVTNPADLENELRQLFVPQPSNPLRSI